MPILPGGNSQYQSNVCYELADYIHLNPASAGNDGGKIDAKAMLASKLKTEDVITVTAAKE